MQVTNLKFGYVNLTYINLTYRGEETIQMHCEQLIISSLLCSCKHRIKQTTSLYINTINKVFPYSYFSTEYVGNKMTKRK